MQPGRWPPVGLRSRTNPEAEDAGLILLEKVLFTGRTLSTSFSSAALWVPPSCASGLSANLRLWRGSLSPTTAAPCEIGHGVTV